jgi:hypothetical protein
MAEKKKPRQPPRPARVRKVVGERKDNLQKRQEWFRKRTGDSKS